VALSKLTAQIDRLKGLPRGHGTKELNDKNCYRYRARVLTKLGNEQLDVGSPEALELAQSFYDKAIAELDVGRNLIVPADAKRRSQTDVYLAGARVGLGFLALQQSRLHDAQALYRESEDILGRQPELVRPEPDFTNTKDRLDHLDRKIRANLSASR
jgi:hypothetical protein